MRTRPSLISSLPHLAGKKRKQGKKVPSIPMALANFREKWKMPTLLASPVAAPAPSPPGRRSAPSVAPPILPSRPAQNSRFPSLLRRAGHMEPISPVTLKSRRAPAFRHGAPGSPRLRGSGAGGGGGRWAEGAGVGGEETGGGSPTARPCDPSRAAGPGRRQLTRESSPADVGSAEAPPAVA